MTLSSVGKRVPKKDAPIKVTGAASYIQDVTLPNMLYGKILYSRFPHARILRIDTTRAEKLPGVKAVLTGDNIPPFKFGVYKDNPPLNKKVIMVRHEAVGITNPVVVLDHIGQDGKETNSVFVIEKDRLPCIAPGGDMIESTGILYS